MRAADASAALAFCTEFAHDEDQPAARRAEAFVARARAHEVQNQTIAAIADLTAALELNPKSAAAFHRRGMLWTRERNFDQAIKDFSSALTLSPVLCRTFMQNVRAAHDNFLVVALKRFYARQLEIALAHLRIEVMTVGFGSTMHSEVLGAGCRLQITLILTLHPQHKLHPQA